MLLLFDDFNMCTELQVIGYPDYTFELVKSFFSAFKIIVFLLVIICFYLVTRSFMAIAVKLPIKIHTH